MWWRQSWFSLNGTIGIQGQERGALLRHSAPQHQPTDPCTTLASNVERGHHAPSCSLAASTPSRSSPIRIGATFWFGVNKSSSDSLCLKSPFERSSAPHRAPTPSAASFSSSPKQHTSELKLTI